MATAEDYARWIVANPDKKGTPDFDTVAKAYQAARGVSPSAPITPQHDAIAARVNGDAISRDAQGGPSFLSEVGNQIGNLVAGGVRGAGSIGATALSPVDAAVRAANGGKPISVGGYDIAGHDRRAGMDQGLQAMGADTNSPAFRVGKVGSELAGTAGAGGAVANLLGRAPAVAAVAPNLLTAIRTSGMSGGATSGAANLLTRATGGAIAGGTSAGMVDPEQAAQGAEVGGALPVAAKVAGVAGKAVGNGLSNLADATANRLMQSAIKPTIAQLKSGEAATAVQTLLDYGINPTKGGVQKLKDLIADKNSEIASAIAGSNATIPKQNVVNALADVRQRFGNQVSPTSDLNAIQAVENDFMAHPNLPGSDIPVQAAQEMKQGTYKVLAKKYGQVGAADTEAQKGLARGLKEEIAMAVPAVGPLNAEESRLITTLNVAERRALMEMNKNPMGLATLAKNPAAWAAFMADKSALFKSLAARAVNSASNFPNALQGALGNQSLNQLGYQVAPNALTKH